MSVLGWGPGSWVLTKKILIVMSDPMIFTPLGTTTKTGKQANYRSTWMETKNGARVHNAIFPTMNKYSLFMNNAKYSFRKESRENHPKWSKGDKDGQVSYGITSRYKLKIGTNELTAWDTASQTKKGNFRSPRYKDVGHGVMSCFRLIYTHYYW